MPTRNSVPNTATSQSRPGQGVNLTSTSPDGDPSKYPKEPSNNSCLVQETGQNYTLVPSKSTPSDTGEEWNKTRLVKINQPPEGFSFASGSEIFTNAKRFKEREHIYAQAVCSFRVSALMLTIHNVA